MTREKKKFRPGKELKEVFDAVDRRRASAREKFVARKQGLNEKKRQQEAKEAEKANKSTQAKRQNRLKKDPAKVEQRAKEIMDKQQ